MKRETIKKMFIGAGLIFLSTLTVLFVRHLDILPHREAPGFRTLGDKTAKIHIEEFTDFACPACAGAHKIVHSLLKIFKGKIRLSVKHTPWSNLHIWSVDAAVYADCAGEQKKFWEYADLLFKNQKNWALSKKMPKEFKLYAKKLELDMNKFDACANNPETLKTIKLDISEGEMLGINATPTFFINKKRAVGAAQLIKNAKTFEHLLKK